MRVIGRTEIMCSVTVVVLSLVVSSFAGPALAQDEVPPSRVALMPLRAPSLSKTKADTLAAALWEAAGELFATDVIVPEGFGSVLTPDERRLAERCGDGTCWARLARTLEASLVVGVEAKNGDELRVTLTAVLGGGGGVVARHQETIETAAALYATAARVALARLCGKLPDDLREALVDEAAAAAVVADRESRSPAAGAREPAGGSASGAEEELEQPVRIAPDFDDGGDVAPAVVATAGTAVPAEADPAALQRKGYVGLRYRAVDRKRATEDGTASGAAVTRVAAGGPAARAGVAVGDVIRLVNGNRIHDPAQLAKLFAAMRAGQVVRLTVWRGGSKREIEVTLAEAPRRASRQ